MTMTTSGWIWWPGGSTGSTWRAATRARGTLKDPRITGVYFYTGGSGSEDVVPGSRDPGDSGEGLNDRSEFTATRTGTHVIFVTSAIRWDKGTYRLTVQEIVDDLGVWHTDWGAEELGGFIRPFQEEATGNLYGRPIVNRTGTRDTDGFLLYLGYDGAPLDGEYVLTVTGLDAPMLMAETYYDDPIGDHLADDYVPAMKALRRPLRPGRRLHRVPRRPPGPEDTAPSGGHAAGRDRARRPPPGVRPRRRGRWGLPAGRPQPGALLRRRLRALPARRAQRPPSPRGRTSLAATLGAIPGDTCGSANR